MVEVFTANHMQVTPRAAIDEMLTMRKEDWWLKRVRAVKKHLEGATFHGRPLLDEPMSMSAIDAVLKEAWYFAKDKPDAPR